MRKIEAKEFDKLALHRETYIKMKKLFVKGGLFLFNMKGFFHSQMKNRGGRVPNSEKVLCAKITTNF